MPLDKIFLRGHHISSLAWDYLSEHIPEETRRQVLMGNISNAKKHLPQLKNVNPYSVSEDEMIRMVYGDEFCDYYKNLLDTLVNDPTHPIEVVKGLDSLCLAAGGTECVFFEPSCVFEDQFKDVDKEILKEYGLDVGEKYTSSDIIETIIDYYLRTGYINPGDKLIQEKNKKLWEKTLGGRN
jgi:hypothetical protein